MLLIHGANGEECQYRSSRLFVNPHPLCHFVARSILCLATAGKLADPFAPAGDRRLIRASTGRKVISDYLAALHYESNSLYFAYVGHWVSGNRDEISELAGLDAPMRSCQPSISAAFV